jgi:hypothetical protein
MKMKVFLFLFSLICILESMISAEIPCFKLKEYLGRQWQSEKVQYPITPEMMESIRQKKGLVDSNGQETVYQVDEKNGKICFLANLKPFSENIYSFTKSNSTAKSDIVVSENDEFIEMSNSKFGIRINRELKDGSAPIQAWRWPSGKWAGKTNIQGKGKIKEYKAELLAKGPVFALVNCHAVFDDGGSWDMSFELQAFEPLVKIGEKFNCPKPYAYKLVLNDNFNADEVLFRAGASGGAADGKPLKYGQIKTEEIDKTSTKAVLEFEPWLHWGGYYKRVTSFSLFNKQDNDLLFLASCNPSKWVDPQIKREDRAGIIVPLLRDSSGRLTITYELKKGEREYLLGALPKSEVHAILDEKDQVQPPLPQQCQMKHSDFPLDRIKDFVLEWNEKERQHPRLLLTARQLEEFRKTFTANKEDVDNVKKYVKAMNPLNVDLYEDAMSLYLATGDRGIEEAMINLAMKNLQELINRNLELKGLVSVGAAPHGQGPLISLVVMIDSISSSPNITSEQKQRIQAQLAFLAYLFNSQSFWSVKRGYVSFLNMTVIVEAVKCYIAAMLPDHPESKEWMSSGLAYMREILDSWVDENGNLNGGEIESPSYAMYSFDTILGSFTVASNTGANDWISDPKIKTMAEYFAKISTPPDARVKNWRHNPPVGNTYKFEPSGEFSLLAAIWKDKDPEFSAHMAWMQKEHGNQLISGVGGFFPAFHGYRKIYTRFNLQEKAPLYKSEIINETAAILRSNYATDRETMLYMIAGAGRSHYDNDSGSITIWGKKSIISDDFGYKGYMPPRFHSMIDSPASNFNMKIMAFQTSDSVDYVAGTKDAWERKILLIKNGTSDYFVINDSFPVPLPATWRQWFEAKNVDLMEKDALVTGLNDVDVDIFFSDLPQKCKSVTENETVRTFGMDSEGGQKYTTSSQTAIKIDSPRFKKLLTLVYPRLRIEQKPEVVAIADGSGFKISAGKSVDYVFASREPIIFKDGKLLFNGTVGFARVDDNDIKLELPAPGEISYADKKLKKEKEKKSYNELNLVKDGEMLSGNFTVFDKSIEEKGYELRTVKENPAKDGTAMNGPFCQFVKYNLVSPSNHFLFGKIYVDSQKKYRIRARVYIPEDTKVMFCGYAGYANQGGNKNTWGWDLTVNGPTKGWQDFETTLGPKGSGTKQEFPEDVISVGLSVRMFSATGKFSFYLDDFVFEEIPSTGTALPSNK